MYNVTHGLPPLLVFGEKYPSVHGYLSLVVCLIGVPLNVSFIYILSKREMVTAVNRLLQAIGMSCINYLTCQAASLYDGH